MYLRNAIKNWNKLASNFVKKIVFQLIKKNQKFY